MPDSQIANIRELRIRRAVFKVMRKLRLTRLQLRINPIYQMVVAYAVQDRIRQAPKRW